MGPAPYRMVASQSATEPEGKKAGERQKEEGNKNKGGKRKEKKKKRERGRKRREKKRHKKKEPRKTNARRTETDAPHEARKTAIPPGKEFEQHGQRWAPRYHYSHLGKHRSKAEKEQNVPADNRVIAQGTNAALWQPGQQGGDAQRYHRPLAQQ